MSIVQLTCKISKFIESVDQINFSRSIFGRSEAKICVKQGFPRSGDATGILVGPIPVRSAR